MKEITPKLHLMMRIWLFILITLMWLHNLLQKTINGHRDLAFKKLTSWFSSLIKWNGSSDFNRLPSCCQWWFYSSKKTWSKFLTIFEVFILEIDSKFVNMLICIRRWNIIKIINLYIRKRQIAVLKKVNTD